MSDSEPPPVAQSVGKDSDARPWQLFLDSLPPVLRALHEAPRPDDVLPLETGRSVTRADLLAVLIEQTAAAPHREPRIRPDRLEPGLLAGAWHRTVFGQARAVLRLLDAEFEVEALANARVALEHAIALQELAQSADSGDLDALLTDMALAVQRRQKQQLDYLERLDQASGGTHSALLGASIADHEARSLPSKASGRRTVKAMFDRVSPGGHLYSVYSQLSESSHAGLGSAAHYLKSALRTGTAVVPPSADPVDWAETAALLSWSCWAADDAMLRFWEGGSALAARHVPLMARVGLSTG